MAYTNSLSLFGFGSKQKRPSSNFNSPLFSTSQQRMMQAQQQLSSLQQQIAQQQAAAQYHNSLNQQAAGQQQFGTGQVGIVSTGGTYTAPNGGWYGGLATYPMGNISGVTGISAWGPSVTPFQTPGPEEKIDKKPSLKEYLRATKGETP